MPNDDSTLYDNLLRATDNLQDISFTRYATVLSVNGDKCTAKEENSTLQHQNCLLLSKGVKVGDKVVLGFVDNSIHQPVILGVIGGTQEGASDETIILALGLGRFKIRTDGYLYVELPVTTSNFFSIDSNGYLNATLPSGVTNDYNITTDGILTYNREEL